MRRCRSRSDFVRRASSGSSDGRGQGYTRATSWPTSNANSWRLLVVGRWQSRTNKDFDLNFVRVEKRSTRTFTAAIIVSLQTYRFVVCRVISNGIGLNHFHSCGVAWFGFREETRRPLLSRRLINRVRRSISGRFLIRANCTGSNFSVTHTYDGNLFDVACSINPRRDLWSAILFDSISHTSDLLIQFIITRCAFH